MEDYYSSSSPSPSMVNKDSISKLPEPSSTNGKKAVTSSLRKWIRSELTEIVAGMFAGGGRKHRVNSAEFRYDPLSYALNFEDGDSVLDEFPLRDFSARLPSSPKRNVVVSREVAAWS